MPAVEAQSCRNCRGGGGPTAPSGARWEGGSGAALSPWGPWGGHGARWEQGQEGGHVPCPQPGPAVAPGRARGRCHRHRAARTGTALVGMNELRMALGGSWLGQAGAGPGKRACCHPWRQRGRSWESKTERGRFPRNISCYRTNNYHHTVSPPCLQGPEGSRPRSAPAPPAPSRAPAGPSPSGAPGTALTSPQPWWHWGQVGAAAVTLGQARR